MPNRAFCTLSAVTIAALVGGCTTFGQGDRSATPDNRPYAFLQTNPRGIPFNEYQALSSAAPAWHPALPAEKSLPTMRRAAAVGTPLPKNGSRPPNSPTSPRTSGTTSRATASTNAAEMPESAPK